MHKIKMKNFPKPNATTIWTAIGIVANVVGFISTTKQQAAKQIAMENASAEKAAEKVMEMLSKKD